MDRPRRKLILLGLAGLLACLFSITLSVSIGSARIPFTTVWSIALNQISSDLVEPFWNAGRENIVWKLRFPRALLAALVGAGLGLAGAVMQGVTRNSLADPHLLGVSAGAAFGANISILLIGNVLGPMTVPLFAFAGALFATMLVISIAGFSRNGGASQLVLGGLAISFIISSGSNVVIMLADPRAISSVMFWMLGGFGFAQWSNLVFPASALAFCGTIFLFHARQLNALAMGDETAVTLGIAVARLRLILLVVSALLTGIMVAFSGMIGFVGLMMPHIARLMLGGDNRIILPASALLGAIFLVLADILARTITAPNDMPIGVVTGLIGGIFFLVLLKQESLRGAVIHLRYLFSISCKKA